MSHRILIVDDERMYCDYLSQILEMEGYVVRTASNSSDGINVGREFAPDLLIADWMLKDEHHGFQVAEALRSELPDLRVIMISGFLSPELREEARQSNIFRFLEKPFSLDDISEAVREAFSDGKSSQLVSGS